MMLSISLAAENGAHRKVLSRRAASLLTCDGRIDGNGEEFISA